MPILVRSLRSVLLLLALFGLFAATGCKTRVGDFSLLSTGTPSYSRMEDATIERQVKGSDGRMNLLFLIPLGSAPSVEEAVDKALDKGHGDFLERVRIYRIRWSVILFGYEGYRVIADVGNSRPTRGSRVVPQN